MAERAADSRSASSFENHIYRGYEVHLRLERTNDYEPFQIENPRSIYRFMHGLAHESAEYVYELLMDQKHRVTATYLVGKGGVASSVSFRQACMN